MNIEIKSRFNGSVLFSGVFASLKLAVEVAVKAGANLRGANLRGANLRGANLRGADLRDANLRDANLRGANLRGADLRDANLRGADLRDANLRGANLRGANLRGADLRDANLRDANLVDADLGGAESLRLPTGETWEEYLTQTVPALLTAGGKPLDEVAKAWACHDWTNCPMATAFGVHNLEDIPILHRPRAKQFIDFFDAKQLPLEVVTGKRSYADYAKERGEQAGEKRKAKKAKKAEVRS